MVIGASLTVIVTTLSSTVGPKWSGLLTMFPLLGIILSEASYRAHGPDFAILLLRGMVWGRFSFAAFCLCLIFALPLHTTLVAFLEASIVAMTVQGVTRGLPTRGRRFNSDPLRQFNVRPGSANLSRSDEICGGRPPAGHDVRRQRWAFRALAFLNKTQIHRL